MDLVRALADLVATKLGILFFFFFPSTYFSPRRGLPMILNFCMPLCQNRAECLRHGKARTSSGECNILTIFGIKKNNV